MAAFVEVSMCLVKAALQGIEQSATSQRARVKWMKRVYWTKAFRMIEVNPSTQRISAEHSGDTSIVKDAEGEFVAVASNRLVVIRKRASVNSVPNPAVSTEEMHGRRVRINL